jgi:hypothetical protein
MLCAIAETGIFPRVFSPPDPNRRIVVTRAVVALAALFASLPIGAIERIAISADSIESNGVVVKKAVALVRVGADPAVELEADQLEFGGKSTIASPGISCVPLAIRAGRLECKAGQLRAEKSRFPFSARFDFASSRLALASDLDSGERWTADATLDANPQAVISIRKGQLSRFAGWIPEGQPKPGAGTIDADIRVSTRDAGSIEARAEGRLSGVAFSDTAGLKAGEKLDIAVKADVSRTGEGAPANWSLSLDYVGGEVFWQPIYVARGGHRLTARGDWQEGTLNVRSGQVSLADIGNADFSGSVATKPFAIVSADVKTTTLSVAPLYDTFVKPVFAQSMLGEAAAQGSISATAAIRNGRLAQAQLTVADLSLDDPRGRFAIKRLSTVVPWERGKPTSTRVVFDSATVLNIPIGRVSFPLALDDNGINVRRIALPILDGRLEVRNFDLERVGEGEQATWTWRMDGRITPISMEALTAALKLPVMKGTLSGEIPNVVYARQTLAVNGEIDIGVFGGKMSGRDIVLLEPFGRAPRFLGNFSARNLDLNLLTSTFSFGRMEGRIDADVRDLELADWKPVKFDAEIKSSPGEYRKRVSQQAVQNISALGGGGAAAAIQRSFLRIFEEFGYDRLGLSCRLNNGICAMGGVEDAPQGYVIVKGGGIPSLTVLGYNRNVSWETLLARVQGIVAGNVKPTIQ